MDDGQSGAILTPLSLPTQLLQPVCAMGASQSRVQTQPVAAPPASTSATTTPAPEREPWPKREVLRTLRDGSTVLVVPPRDDMSLASPPFVLHAASMLLLSCAAPFAAEAWVIPAGAAPAALPPRSGRLRHRAGWLALGAGCTGIAAALVRSHTVHGNVRRAFTYRAAIDSMVLDSEYPGTMAFMYALVFIPVGIFIEPAAALNTVADAVTTGAALALPPLLAATSAARALRIGPTEATDAAELRRWAALGALRPKAQHMLAFSAVAIKLLSLFVPPRTFLMPPPRPWFSNEERTKEAEERREQRKRRRWLHNYDDEDKP